jgi:hypothetical protein
LGFSQRLMRAVLLMHTTRLMLKVRSVDQGWPMVDAHLNWGSSARAEEPAAEPVEQNRR